MAVAKYKLGTFADLMTTELDSLASTSQAVSTGFYNNTQGGGGGDGFRQAIIRLTVDFVSAPAAGSCVSIWFLTCADDTNYEDGGSSITPQRYPDVKIFLNATTAAQIADEIAAIPPGKFKTLARNDATGQPFPASGSKISLRPFTDEGV